ncbi:MAG: hypothetical protein ACK50A_12430 [Sphingobacteriaceae bacterium]
MKNIKLNFLPFINQNINVVIYIKENAEEKKEDSNKYFKNIKVGDKHLQHEIAFEEKEGFKEYTVNILKEHDLVSQYYFEKLNKGLPSEIKLIKNESFRNKKIHIILGNHAKGKNCVWIEPYFHKQKNIWGILLDYSFVTNTDEDGDHYKLDRDILIQTGTLNQRGDSNLDFYIFKNNYYKKFLSTEFSKVNAVLDNNLSNELFNCEANLLDAKTYIFQNNNISNSPYLGLAKYAPLEEIKENVLFYFIYKKTDRDIAVALLKGLRGESSPNTFGGMEKLFRLNFQNDRIKGASIEEFSDGEIDTQIQNIKALNSKVIPIIITNSKKTVEDEELYFRLKHKFTNAGIPCQVVTKDLVNNEYSIKYSLSNIGLQIFAKAGGKPWKMKPATNEYLIIGIGQSYTHEKTENGVIVEKNLTYSVLTDSSGLFKDIKVLGEAMFGNDDYYQQLISNLTNIINNSGHKKISIHSPFRISEEKILNKVLQGVKEDIELNVIIINHKNDFFGFDYENNGLVPFESTFIQLGSKEYLVWFEGLQFSNPKITKRYGNPLLIKFWYSNKPDNFKDTNYKNKLLQDCINLSGANWRGFKAKQLPVSVFYCQRIADFISKFQKYNLQHIDIDNLNPWFL